MESRKIIDHVRSARTGSFPLQTHSSPLLGSMKGDFGGRTVKAVGIDLAKKYVARIGVKVDSVQEETCIRGMVTSRVNSLVGEDSPASEELANENVSSTVNSVTLSGMRSVLDRVIHRGTVRV